MAGSLQACPGLEASLLSSEAVLSHSMSNGQGELLVRPLLGRVAAQPMQPAASDCCVFFACPSRHAQLLDAPHASFSGRIISFGTPLRRRVEHMRTLGD